MPHEKGEKNWNTSSSQVKLLRITSIYWSGFLLLAGLAGEHSGCFLQREELT